MCPIFDVAMDCAVPLLDDCTDKDLDEAAEGLAEVWKDMQITYNAICVHDGTITSNVWPF